MKLGTHILLPDGQIGTVVYNALIGVGIKWGKHYPDPKDFVGTAGNLHKSKVSDSWRWYPDAILRDPWPGCEEHGFARDECVGENYTIVKDKEN